MHSTAGPAAAAVEVLLAGGQRRDLAQPTSPDGRRQHQPLLLLYIQQRSQAEGSRNCLDMHAVEARMHLEYKTSSPVHTPHAGKTSTLADIEQRIPTDICAQQLSPTKPAASLCHLQVWLAAALLHRAHVGSSHNSRYQG
jgi:hypothetical protein